MGKEYEYGQMDKCLRENLRNGNLLKVPPHIKTVKDTLDLEMKMVNESEWEFNT